MKNKYTGLTIEEVEQRRKEFGLNELIKNEKINPAMKFLGIFKEPMFALLIGAAFLYIILGEAKDAMIMLFFVMFVATITFIQEWKTEKTLNALKDLTTPTIKVIRDGREIIIKSIDLVPGDIISLSEGERIPADCQVLEVSNFSVDESVLTGEAEAVFKVPIGTEESEKDYWKKDMLYAGTLVVFGKAIAKVKYIGVDTEYGKIGKAVIETKEEMTPLQKKVGSLVKSLTITGGILCVIVIVISYIYNGDLLKSILSGITLAMGIIPEEFPVVLTVFLSLGAFRLAKKNALMRKVSAVETLGVTTVLCVDKTGTITENSMTVRKIYDYNSFLEVENFKNKELSKVFTLSCEKDPYDSMEKAIVYVGEKNLQQDYFKELTLVKKYPFDAKTKRMGNVFEAGNKYYVAAKGSPETLLPLCKVSTEEKINIEKAIDEMALKGLRVLAFAEAIENNIFDSMDEYNFSFKGLVGLQDPPKKGVKELVEVCKKAGIRVIMITGDYSKTAVAIGEEIGLQFSEKSITGEEIDQMSEEELKEAVSHCDVYSRVIPEHKMKIVKALKNNGDIVAMTGDGVNDAPALKNADIGIAMGKRGTEVAKEAAHMVLLDDDFATIVHSIKDGRRIFDNIRKAIVYILIIHIPMAALALFAPIFNIPQLLLPMHIMLLELIIDPTCAVVFEGERAELDIMNQCPRSPKEPLLTPPMFWKVVTQGITLFLATFIPFHFLIDAGNSVEFSRTFSLVVLILGNITLVLVNSSNTRLIIDLIKDKGNKSRFLINLVALVMLIAIVYIPFMNEMFKTKALNLTQLISAMSLGILSTGWFEIVKLFQIIKRKYAYSEKVI